VGGRYEALKPPGERWGTTDREIAVKLLADRIVQLEQRRRDRYLLGRTNSATLAEYSVHHLRVKARSGNVRYETVAGNHRALGVFMDRVGADRPLESITTEDIVEYDTFLSTLPGLYGQTLSGQSRRHYLNAISNLYRRAQSEGYVPPGYNPVAAMIDKPTGRQLEARWLEVHEGALLLEAARVFEGKRADLAIPFVHTLIGTLLLTGGRWREVAGLLVSDVSFERHTITFRPHEHRRLKTQTSHRKWAWVDSNYRPHAYQARALKAAEIPLETTPPQPPQAARP
jgi:integrase